VKEIDMETAKVDVRKLQLLNDRINQCIDALHQVRLSVHGLSHTPANGSAGTTAQAAGYIDQRFIDPRTADPRFGYGVNPGVPGYGGGLAHSPFQPAPWAGYAPVAGLGVAGIGAGGPVPGQIPAGIWNQGFTGLSHTGIEAESIYNRPLWVDPLLAARMAQTFPFVQFTVPPVISVY
jgi:hypothetical protein